MNKMGAHLCQLQNVPKDLDINGTTVPCNLGVLKCGCDFIWTVP